MRKFNKSGELDEVFDFLFFIGLAVVMFTFIFMVIDGSVEKAKEKSIASLSGFHREEARIANIQNFIREKDNTITELETKASHLNIFTIRECSDYLTKKDCYEDFMNVNVVGDCGWNEAESICT